jgi:hypothetical protein
MTTVPSRITAATVLLTAFIVLLTISSASAIDKCKVKVDKKTGVINVDASGLGGPLLWGPASGSETNAFFNAGTCIAGDKAKRCQLASPATLAAKTAPSGCTLYLTDGVTPCSAWISGCSPGARSAAGALLKDANGVLIGTVLDGYGSDILRNENGTTLHFVVNGSGNGFFSSGQLYYLTNNCTGTDYALPDPSMVKPVSVHGTTGYYAPTTSSSQTFLSILTWYGQSYLSQTDCDNNFGVGNATFVGPDSCCWFYSNLVPLGPPQTIDLSVFTTPFAVEVQ